MRFVAQLSSYLATLTASILLVACGGGGVGETVGDVTSPGLATLTGQVVEVDGETNSVGGIALKLLETGRTVTTLPDGTFSFGTVPTSGVTLAVSGSSGSSTPGLSTATSHGPGMGGGEGEHGSGMGGHDDEEDHGSGGHHGDCDEDSGVSGEDGESLCDGDAHIHHADEDDEIHLRLRICEGRIEEMHTYRHGRGEHEVEIEMLRTPDNDDPDMEGRLELESRDDGDRMRAGVEYATPGRDLELIVISPAGLEETQGTRTVGADGEAEWSFDTSNGGRLPFGVAAVEDLEGYDVEVRDFSTQDALLVSTAPEMPPHMGDPMDSGDEAARTRGRMRLESRVEGIEGYVEMRHRESRNEERFEVEVAGLTPGRVVEVYLQDAAESASFTLVGTMTASADGHGELEIDKRDGDPLPHGAGHVSDLMGLKLEIRDATSGEVLLSGHAPAMMHDH